MRSGIADPIKADWAAAETVPLEPSAIGDIMPLYQCISPEGLFDESGRQQIVAEITRIHCDTMAVPPSLVNVLFLDVTPGRFFTAGRGSRHSVLLATVRQGHDVATRQRLLRDLSDAWVRLTGQPATELIVSLSEILTENTMEGGAILPEPEADSPARSASRS